MRSRLLALAAILSAGACTPPEGDGAQPVDIGRPVPSYRAVSVAGDSVSLADQRGKVVLLNVWATWCHPCREEVPELQALHERYAPRGLAVVGVSVDADGEQAAIREFARDYRMTYPVWLDPGERVSQTFLVVGVPATYLIGKDGTLLWRKAGPVRPGDTTLARLIEGAL